MSDGEKFRLALSVSSSWRWAPYFDSEKSNYLICTSGWLCFELSFCWRFV